MIIGSFDNGEVILIGLSKGNMEELLKNRPILKTKEETDLPVTILIVGGETEEEILIELSENFNMPDEISDMMKTGDN
jgi:hypothetical protein